MVTKEFNITPYIEAALDLFEDKIDIPTQPMTCGNRQCNCQMLPIEFMGQVLQGMSNKMLKDFMDLVQETMRSNGVRTKMFVLPEHEEANAAVKH